MAIKKIPLISLTAGIIGARATIGLVAASLEDRSGPQVTPPALVLTGPFLVLLLIAAFGISQNQKWGYNLALAASGATAVVGASGTFIFLNRPGSFLPGPLMGLTLSVLTLGWLLCSGVRQKVFNQTNNNK
jgi:uncharacterized membrane protein (UPF0136 family)